MVLAFLPYWQYVILLFFSTQYSTTIEADTFECEIRKSTSMVEVLNLTETNTSYHHPPYRRMAMMPCVDSLTRNGFQYDQLRLSRTVTRDSHIQNT
jgi:hypothetical protein